LDVTLEDVGATKGSSAQSAAVWAFFGVGAAVALEVLASLVRLEAHGTPVRS
jgi:hypothetical protein